MGFFQLACLGLVGGAVLLGIFIQYAKKEMANFPIDYSGVPGKIIVITGANSGLGYYTSLALAKADATVVMACRSAARCEEAKQSILQEVPKGKIDSLILDLSSFASVRDFVDNFKSNYDHLDVLINNAGIMALPTREVTADGLEAQIGINHFGHFLLTALLYPYFAPNGRIINHSSSAHAFAAKNFVAKDLFSETVYSPWVAYGNSKAANLFFTFELNRRLSLFQNPKNIKSIAVHPGYTATNLQSGRFPLSETLNSIFAMKGADGALSQIYAAVDPHAQPSYQDYIGPIYLSFGKPTVQGIAAEFLDVNSHKKLWEISEEITGTNFSF